MKTMFRTLGIVAVTALFAVACGKSCEEKLTDFEASTAVYVLTTVGNDCDAANEAIADWKNKYSDLCDEDKDQGAYDLILAGHDAWLADNDCN